MSDAGSTVRDVGVVVELEPVRRAKRREAMIGMHDVCQMLAVDRRTVVRCMLEYGLPGRKIAGQWRFYPSDVASWIDRQEGRDGTT